MYLWNTWNTWCVFLIIKGLLKTIFKQNIWHLRETGQDVPPTKNRKHQCLFDWKHRLKRWSLVLVNKKNMKGKSSKLPSGLSEDSNSSNIVIICNNSMSTSFIMQHHAAVKNKLCNWMKSVSHEDRSTSYRETVDSWHGNSDKIPSCSKMETCSRARAWHDRVQISNLYP